MRRLVPAIVLSTCLLAPDIVEAGTLSRDAPEQGAVAEDALHPAGLGDARRLLGTRR